MPEPAPVPAPRSTVLPRIEAGEVVFPTGRSRYERVKPLGEGGMGEVALARDHDIERPVAIKRLRAELQHGHGLLRFAQEIRMIGRLEHPSIIPVHDVGVDEAGQHYFVMKYVEGDTLEKIIEKLQAHDPAYERRFPHEVRAQIFLSVLRAVQYAHAQGIIHRDIKPANIMVGPYGEVVLMDWGLARPLRGGDLPAEIEPAPQPAGAVTSSLETHHGSIMGTPHYMSPEQARGETDKIDERSDVFSLAVTFHEFISLRHYLDGIEKVEEVLAAVATIGERERNIVGWIGDAVATGAPMEYLHFIRHGLAADPAHRYANAGEMADTLSDIMSGRMKVQCHVTATKRAVFNSLHAVDRHPLVATVLLLAVVGASLTGVVAMVLGILRLTHVI
jgi:serine/threonine-protein kinase